MVAIRQMTAPVPWAYGYHAGVALFYLSVRYFKFIVRCFNNRIDEMQTKTDNRRQDAGKWIPLHIAGCCPKHPFEDRMRQHPGRGCGLHRLIEYVMMRAEKG